jgi:hypothetical protein
MSNIQYEIRKETIILEKKNKQVSKDLTKLKEKLEKE